MYIQFAYDGKYHTGHYRPTRNYWKHDAGNAHSSGAVGVFYKDVHGVLYFLCVAFSPLLMIFAFVSMFFCMFDKTKTWHILNLFALLYELPLLKLCNKYIYFFSNSHVCLAWRSPLTISASKSSCQTLESYATCFYCNNPSDLTVEFY